MRLIVRPQTWRGIYVSGADVAFKLFEDGGARGVGSFLLQDATIQSCKTGILTLPPAAGAKSGTTNIVLDTVAFASVPTPVADTTGAVLLSGPDPMELTDVWTLGNIYVQGDSPANTQGLPTYTTGKRFSGNRPPGLVNGDDGTWSSKWYKYQRKPQYEYEDVNSFVNVKDYGAKGSSLLGTA